MVVCRDVICDMILDWEVKRVGSTLPSPITPQIFLARRQWMT